MRALVVAGILAAASCEHPAAVPLGPIDAGPPSSACVSSCQHAASLGCSEGADPACATTCTATAGSVVGRTVDWSCVNLATTRAGAQTCGVRFCGATP